jgi:hypothetical protein
MAGIGASVSIPATVAAPVRAARLAVIDGARGYLLISMYVGHLCIEWNEHGVFSWLNHMRHGRYLAVGDVEFFLVLSGFVCALSYARAFAAGGVSGTARAVLRRLAWIYGYQVAATVILVLLARGGVPGIDLNTSGGADPTWAQILKSFTLAVQPENLDILILYFVLMPVMPLAFVLLERGRTGVFFGALIAAWLVARIGLDHRASAWITAHGFDWQRWFGLMGHFDPWSYAILFYGGFMLGDRYRRLGDDWLQGAVWQSRWLVAAAAACVIAAFAIGMRTNPHGPLGMQPNVRLSVETAAITVSIFTLMVVLLCSQGLPRPIATLAGAVRAALSLRLFVFLGQNSLFVYALHVIIVVLVTAIAMSGSVAPGQLTLLALAAAGLAVIVALTWVKRRLLPTAS